MNLLSERIIYILDTDYFDMDSWGRQAALSKIAGTNRSVVNQWVTGRIKSLNIEYALNIEKNLGYDHIWLMTGRGPKKLTDKANDWPFTLNRSSFERLDDSDKKDIDRYIKLIFKDWAERHHTDESPDHYNKSQKAG